MKKHILCCVIFFAGISLNGFSQTASFSMDISGGCAPLCVGFSDQSTNALSWLWDFGDAGPVSTLQNPTHCYPISGIYNVTLTVTFASGTGSATGTVNVYPNPVAAFSFAYNGNNTVTFTDQSTGATIWNWDFGDMSGTSTVQNPVYTYASSGTYTAFLAVTSSFGCVDSVSHTITPTGIHDYTNSTGWTVFPNPSNGKIAIHSDASLQHSEIVRVENTLGELIFEKEISGNAVIDLSDQPSGIYFVRVGNSPARKMIIE